LTRACRKLLLAPALAALTLAACACPPACAAEQPPATDRNPLSQARRLLDGACTHERKGELAAAAGDLEAAAALLPEWAPPRALLGRVYQLQGREADARAQYQTYQFLGLLEHGDDQNSDLMLKIAEAEALLVYRINHERLRRGLKALLPSIDLSRMARGHSREMRDLGYFSHTSPRREHQTMSDRFERIFGEKPRCLAENVSRRGGSLYSFTIDNIEDSHHRLMVSDAHRRSILWEKVDRVGVGIAVNERGDYWLTENFASEIGPGK